MKRLFSLCGTTALTVLMTSILGIDSCNEPPPCEAIPQSMMGGFDGVVYTEDSGGQMYADRSELCVNVNDSVYYETNTDYMQTIVIRETLQGIDVFTIMMGDFKWVNGFPAWNGGVLMYVLQDAAIHSANAGTEIAFDGQEAIAYYWEDGFWDTRQPPPQWIADSGTIWFSVVGLPTGAPVYGDFDAGLSPYSQKSSVFTPLVDPAFLEKLRQNAGDF